jgi:hypothetical protein
MAYFLKDKNEFITEFKDYLEKDASKINSFKRRNYLMILDSLKSAVDLVLKDFKNLKQKILIKLNKKENYWKEKETFIKQNNKLSEEHLNSKNKNIPMITSDALSKVSNLISKPLNFISNNIRTDLVSKNLEKEKNYNHTNPSVFIEQKLNSSPEDNEVFRESNEVMTMFKEKDVKDIEKTKHIISELSDLMTNFSLKVLEHQHMTQNSK